MNLRGEVLRVISLGERDYSEVLVLQRGLQRALIEGVSAETLVVCSHPAVITAGTSSQIDSYLRSEDEINAAGIAIHKIERGGDLTYHGPGQIVCYPILDLNLHKRDVHWYMRSLEQVVINVLSRVGLSGRRIEGRTGVWINPDHESSPVRKICSIGVRLSRWCSLHGFSLYLNDQSSGFQYIKPCGFSDIEITSIAQELERLSNGVTCPSHAELETLIVNEFGLILGFNSFEYYRIGREARLDNFLN